MATRPRKPKIGETEYGKGYSNDLDEGRIEYGPQPQPPTEDIPDQSPDDFNRYGGYHEADDPRPYGGQYSYADHGSEKAGYGREAMEMDEESEEKSNEGNERSERVAVQQPKEETDNKPGNLEVNKPRQK